MLQVYRRKVAEWLDTMGLYHITATMDNAIERAYSGDVTAYDCALDLQRKHRKAA